MNQGIHGIDLLQWLVGGVEQVTAFTTTRAHPGIEVEDVAVASMVFRSGGARIDRGDDGGLARGPHPDRDLGDRGVGPARGRDDPRLALPHAAPRGRRRARAVRSAARRWPRRRDGSARDRQRGAPAAVRRLRRGDSRGAGSADRRRGGARGGRDRRRDLSLRPRAAPRPLAAASERRPRSVLCGRQTGRWTLSPPQARTRPRCPNGEASSQA